MVAMGKNGGHRKLRHRQKSNDINGNTNFCNNNNNNTKNGHNYLNGAREIRNGHGTKLKGTSLKDHSIVGTSVKYIGYSLVLLLFFILFFHTQLEAFIQVLHKSNSSVGESAQTSYFNPIASHQSDPQLAKIPGKNNTI